MHPALIVALVAERERELARRTRHAWRQPDIGAARPARRRPRRAQRLTGALARGLGFLS
jgi:hypothetical protein